MLVLARRPGEMIRIGDAITITVVEIQYGKVRIGIDAPRDVAVNREEVYQRILREGNAEGPAAPAG